MPKQKIYCNACGKSIYRYKSQIGPNNYCSMTCLAKTKKHGSVLHCHMCDRPFYRRYGEQDIDTRKNSFCSRECYFEYRIANSKDTTYLKVGAVHIHRLIAESILGRKLWAQEVVHHIDGNRHNNHFSNMVVFPNQGMHAKCHAGGLSEDEIQRFSLKQKVDSQAKRLQSSD